MSIYLTLFLLSTAFSMGVFGYIAWAARHAYRLGLKTKKIGPTSGSLLRMVGYLSLGINVQALLWITIFLIPRIAPNIAQASLYVPVAAFLMIVAQMWTAAAVIRLWHTLWP